MKHAHGKTKRKHSENNQPQHRTERQGGLRLTKEIRHLWGIRVITRVFRIHFQRLLPSRIGNGSLKDQHKGINFNLIFARIFAFVRSQFSLKTRWLKRDMIL